MKCSFHISNFLDEISSLSHSIVFSISLHCSLKSLSSPFYSLEPCIQLSISFRFSFAFSLIFFSQPFVRSPQIIILPSCISFFFRMILVTAVMYMQYIVPSPYTLLRTSIHSSSGALSDRIPLIYLYLHSIVDFPTFFKLGLNFVISSS